MREAWARDGDRTCRPLGLKLIIHLEVAKISSAYSSRIQRISVDPGLRDGPIAGLGRTAKFLKKPAGFFQNRLNWPLYGFFKTLFFQYVAFFEYV
jgi:hypothetical protein